MKAIPSAVPALMLLAMGLGPVGPALGGGAPDPSGVRPGPAPALPADDGADRRDAERGFVATWDEPAIPRDDGRGIAWRFPEVRAFEGARPADLHPSLWRQSALMAIHGLFEVAPRVWQVRGFDLSVLTLVAGETGWVLIDPLTTIETARAALALANRHLGARPVMGVIYSHSHVDHFGGGPGVISKDEVRARGVPVVAPDGFMAHAVSENLLAGHAMARRARFQFGTGLGAGPAGSGLGAAVPTGASGLIPPTDIIRATGEERVIDGVRLRFQLMPDTEAPANMNIHLPDLSVLHMADNAVPMMHNFLTPRGALVRDAKAWADGLTEAIRMFGLKTDVMVAGHGWPRFGREAVLDVLGTTRDAIKFVHDQAVRRLNAGASPEEVAEGLVLPPALAARWHNRDTYGTVAFNARAVHQRYLGWYSGNPARLFPHPPAALGRRMVDALGGAERTLALARDAQARGDHRFALTLLDHLMFAGEGRAEARAALAASHRAMAAGSEPGIFRNMHLLAAQEAETGVAAQPAGAAAGGGLAALVPVSDPLDLLATRIVPERVPETPFTLALEIADAGERHLVTVRHGVMVHEAGVDDPADAALTLSRADFLGALAGRPPAAMPRISGDARLVATFLGLFEAPDPDFPVVAPRGPDGGPERLAAD